VFAEREDQENGTTLTTVVTRWHGDGYRPWITTAFRRDHGHVRIPPAAVAKNAVLWSIHRL
jgi:hypothetical protein